MCLVAQSMFVVAIVTKKGVTKIQEVHDVLAGCPGIKIRTAPSLVGWKLILQVSCAHAGSEALIRTAEEIITKCARVISSPQVVADHDALVPIVRRARMEMKEAQTPFITAAREV